MTHDTTRCRLKGADIPVRAAASHLQPPPVRIKLDMQPTGETRERNAHRFGVLYLAKCPRMLVVTTL